MGSHPLPRPRLHFLFVDAGRCLHPQVSCSMLSSASNGVVGWHPPTTALWLRSQGRAWHRSQPASA